MSGIVGSRLNIRGSGLVGSLGTDGQVFTSSGAGAGAIYEAAGGITTASQWRLTTAFTGTANPISSNLEVDDTYGAGSLGSAMTESSGIFTFPSTGFWHIIFNGEWAYSGASRTTQAIIKTTTNNSTYYEAAKNSDSITQAESGSTSSTASTSFIFDVTDVTTHKVAFQIHVSNASVTTAGATDTGQTLMVFIRLGDT